MGYIPGTLYVDFWSRTGLIYSSRDYVMDSYIEEKENKKVGYEKSSSK